MGERHSKTRRFLPRIPFPNKRRNRKNKDRKLPVDLTKSEQSSSTDEEQVESPINYKICLNDDEFMTTYQLLIINDGLSSLFEEYSKHQLELHRKPRKYNITQLFDYTIFIDFDYNKAVKVYEKWNEQHSSTVIDETTIDSNLFAVTHTVQQFLNVLDTIFDQFHDLYILVIQAIYSNMETYLLTKLSELWKPDLSNGSLSIKQVPMLIRWYRMYMDVMEEINNMNNTYTKTVDETINNDTIIPISLDWEKDAETLFQHYLQKAVQNSIAEIRTNMDIKDYTTDNQDIQKHKNLPVDAETFIELLVDNAKDLKRTEYGIRVYQTCLESLSQLVDDKQEQIQDQRQGIPINCYCVIINNVQQLSKNLRTYADSKKSSSEPGVAKCYWDKLDKVFESVQHKLLHLKDLSIDCLCCNILDRFGPPHIITTSIGSIGSLSWENDKDNTAIGGMILSLTVSFKDVKERLHSVNLPKVLEKSLRMTIQAYVESFFKNTIKGIRNPKAVSARLETDYTLFQDFFNHYKRRLHDENIINIINSQIQMLNSMSRIINPNNIPNNLVSDASNMLENIIASESDSKKSNNVASIFHIVGLSCGRTKDRNWIKESLQVIVNAYGSMHKSTRNKLFNCDDTTVSGIQLPDLQKSSYIPTVDITRTYLKEISDENTDLFQTIIDQINNVRSK